METNGTPNATPSTTVAKSLIPEKTFNAADLAYVFMALACGFLYWNFTFVYPQGAGVTVFALILLGATLVYFLKSGIKQTAKSWTWFVIAVLMAAQFMLFDNRGMNWLHFMFLSVVFSYWVCVATGRQLGGKISVYVVGEIIRQGFSIPFRNFGCCGTGLKKAFSERKGVKNVLAAVIGVIVFLPLIIIVILLLMSADLAFENFAAGLLEGLQMDKIALYVWQFIIGIPVAFYLYGLVYGNVKGRYADKMTVESVGKAAQSMRLAPRVAIYSVCTVFNVIYLTFFVVQADYLFSAFEGTLPEVFTYSEYANRGFFELCGVAALNLLILMIVHLAAKREKNEEPKMLRVQTAAMVLFTILLIATALSKMVIYIDAYGMTQLRVYASWFMVVLLLVFVVLGVRQFKRFNAARVVVIGIVMMFIGLSYGNIDGMIAKYNISRYEAGTLPHFDFDMLYDLSDAAVAPVYEMYERTDEKFAATREKLENVILQYDRYGYRVIDYGYEQYDVIEEREFRGFNFQSRRAEEIRVTLAAERLGLKESLEIGVETN